MTGFNFALSSQSVQYDKKILEQYIDSFKEDAIVCIPVSYFTFYRGNPTRATGFRYYYFLDPQYINDFSIKEYLLYRIFPILASGENKFGLLWRNENSNHQPITENRYEVYELERAGFKRAEVHYKSIEEGMGEDEELLTRDLYEMIEICQRNNLRVVLITTPLMPAYSDNFSQEFLVEFYNHVDEAIQLYDVEYFDYSRDEEFIYEHDFFRDTDHLNSVGSKVFMERLKEDLAAIGYID